MALIFSNCAETISRSLLKRLLALFSANNYGFGRSETRNELRNFFEVNRYYIVMTALESLSNEGKMDKSKITDAINKYKLDPEKPNPVTV